MLCFQNEHSDERLEQHQQEPTIRASREQSQPLHQYARRLSKEFMAKGKIGREPEFAAFVGIDWADRKPVWCLQALGSAKRETGELEHKVEAVEAWVAELCRRFGHRPIAVAVEQVKGALVFLLNKYECLHIFPVPSTMTASMRKALYPSGAKDDPRDADLLLDILGQHRDKLHHLSLDDEATRRVQNLVEERRKLTLSSRIEEPRILAISGAIPAKGDGAVIEAKSAVVKVIVQLIRSLLQGIAELDQKIEEAAAEHPGFFIFESLPGAGAVMAPRLLAAFGSQRERYRCADELQTYSGIAPVTERSGKRKWVHFRWACPKFLRQSFHEWAVHSIAQSAWARLLPATTRSGQRPSRSGTSVGFQMDSHRIPLLERSGRL